MTIGSAFLCFSFITYYLFMSFGITYLCLSVCTYYLVFKFLNLKESSIKILLVRLIHYCWKVLRKVQFMILLYSLINCCLMQYLINYRVMLDSFQSILDLHQNALILNLLKIHLTLSLSPLMKYLIESLVLF